MKKDNILIFIGARGGSKGVKNKNIRLLLGKPLISYTIAQALKWGKASRVIVSTDSPQIAAVAKKFKAEVPFLRPSSLATDKASKGKALKHALIECEKIYQQRFDIVIDLDVTAPVRTLQDLDNCLAMFRKYKPKTLFSVVHAHKNPYFNMVEEENGKVVFCKKLKKRVIRRQDAPKVYSANASIYFYQRDYVLNSEDPYPLSDKTKIYVMDDFASVDIDREIDFQFIKFLIQDGLVKL